jgi:EAL domain-containing protein (putative c-di-GMP-specific phosphodiesterase class I)
VLQYDLVVTASIGVSFFPLDGGDAATLLRNADSAMYSAKYHGKNDIHCFSAEATASALQRLELETYLRCALERNELRMYYQPQVDLQGRLAGLEVLLMWEHPQLGRISPAQFIPIAEDTGMILSIGSWVLREACRQMAAWRRDGGEIGHIAVNVSALQFNQPNFVSTVAEILEETALPPECLELELTESVVMRDVEQSAELMRQLRNIGVRIAIDDFGTGYSSLSYLRRLPADVLKIDQSFLEHSDLRDARLPLIQTIVVLAHTLGLSVTAEGVEHEEHLELVRKAGCDRAQGHLFGGALDTSAVEPLLRWPDLLAARVIRS